MCQHVRGLEQGEREKMLLNQPIESLCIIRLLLVLPCSQSDKTKDQVFDPDASRVGVRILRTKT